MPEPYGYTGGTITLTNGSAAVSGALTTWGALLPGDEIERGGVRGVIDVVVSNTQLTLRAPWAGASYTGADYAALYRSSNRHDVSRLSERFARWYRDAVYWIDTTGIPDNAVGQDGWGAVDWAAGIAYRKTAGVWGGATTIRLRPRGAYSGATAYLVGDVVTNQSASWVNLAASTGVAPPTLPTETSATWALIAKSGELTRSGTVTAGQVAEWASDGQLRGSTAVQVSGTNLGIGGAATVSTEYKLRLYGAIKCGGAVFLPGSVPANWATYWGGVQIDQPNSLMFASAYGYLGSNGSFKMGLYWNGFRNIAAGWTSLNVNASTAACAVELGQNGIDFATDTAVAGTSPTIRMRLGNNGNLGIGPTALAATAMLDIGSDTMRLRTARTPASATDAGNAGDICRDANFLYVCTATNTWKRAALNTW